MELKTNDWVRSKIDFLVGPHEPLDATVKRRKLAWFEHLTRHDSLSKAMEEDGGDKRLVELELACEVDGVAPPDPV